MAGGDAPERRPRTDPRIRQNPTLSYEDTAPPPAEEYPLPRRAVDVFVAPGQLFAHFRDRTPWVGPLLIAIAVGIAIILVIPSELFVEQARESIRRAGDAAAQMPDAATLAGFARIAGAASVLVATPLMAFASAGVMALLFSVLGGGEAKFRQYLAVVTHSMLITALGGVVTLGIQLLLGDLEARLSLALLTPFLDDRSFAFRILSGLDVFSLWAIVVAALGISIVNRRTTWAVASVVLLGIYVTLLAGVAAIAP